MLKKGIVDLLADTDISDLAFVNQFFQFFPRGVGIRGQRLINHVLPFFLIRGPFECNWPGVIRLQSVGVADNCVTYQ